MAVISTTLGYMDEKNLRLVEGSVENEHESTTWIEYWSEDILVHRSVHVTLKQGLGIEGALANL